MDGNPNTCNSGVAVVAQEEMHNGILAVVNCGYSEKVMQTAKEYCAKHGAAAQAHRANTADTMHTLGVSVRAEEGKEMVLIAAPDAVMDGLLEELGQQCGMRSDAGGVLFIMAIKSV